MRKKANKIRKKKEKMAFRDKTLYKVATGGTKGTKEPRKLAERKNNCVR
jgi:hypothetical protein